MNRPAILPPSPQGVRYYLRRTVFVQRLIIAALVVSNTILGSLLYFGP